MYVDELFLVLILSSAGCTGCKVCKSDFLGETCSQMRVDDPVFWGAHHELCRLHRLLQGQAAQADKSRLLKESRLKDNDEDRSTKNFQAPYLAKMGLELFGRTIFAERRLLCVFCSLLYVFCCF
jgi:hypothetical protein